VLGAVGRAVVPVAEVETVDRPSSERVPDTTAPGSALVMCTEASAPFSVVTLTGVVGLTSLLGVTCTETWGGVDVGDALGPRLAETPGPLHAVRTSAQAATQAMPIAAVR
jgi:hypothetical protein